MYFDIQIILAHTNVHTLKSFDSCLGRNSQRLLQAVQISRTCQPWNLDLFLMIIIISWVILYHFKLSGRQTWGHKQFSNADIRLVLSLYLFCNLPVPYLIAPSQPQAALHEQLHISSTEAVVMSCRGLYQYFRGKCDRTKSAVQF